MLDADLAVLYGVPTKRLNEQVRRKAERFPPDHLFQVSALELADLRSQLATSRSQTGKSAWGGRGHAPFAFTEHGVIVAATVLKSPRAIEASVYVVRPFVRLRELLALNQELAARLDQLEKKRATLDQAIVEILEAIRQLIQTPQASSRPIGVVTSRENRKKPAGKSAKGSRALWR